MKPLEEAQVLNICKIGQMAATCKYLLASKYGFECGKFDKRIKQTLDRKTMEAKGDNCPGVDMGVGV